MDVRRGLGRVAVQDGSEAARRVVRAVRELGREGGGAAAALALHAVERRRSPAVREADEAFELRADVEETLRSARADSAWLGPATLAERASFAEACARAGVTHVGPPADALRWLAAPGALAAVAARVGVPPGEATGLARRIEVVVARDRSGAVRAIALGDTSLRAAGTASLVESPPAGLAPEVADRARVSRRAGRRRGGLDRRLRGGARRRRRRPRGARRHRRGRRLGARRRGGIRRRPRPARAAPRGGCLARPAPPDARRGHAVAARIVAAGAPAGRVEAPPARLRARRSRRRGARGRRRRARRARSSRR